MTDTHAASAPAPGPVTSGGGSAGSSAEVTASASTLIAANRRRRRIRRWVGWGSLPLGLIAALLVAKILSMYAFAYTSVSSYVTGEYSGSIRAAQGQELLNWFEPHLAPFNVGVGLAGSGDLAGGQAKFEEALELAGGLAVCDIRINLALVLEWQGDAATEAGEHVRASEFYSRALIVTSETPEECSSDEAQDQSSDPNRDMSDTLEGLEDRLQEKQQQSEQQQNGEGQQQPQDPTQGDGEQQEQPSPSQEQLDDLEERLRQGEQERQERERGDQPGGGNGTDKPW